MGWLWSGQQIGEEQLMAKKIPMTQQRVEAARLFAQELLAEANERGDQDWATVEWAIGYLMRRSNEKVGPNLPLAA